MLGFLAGLPGQIASVAANVSTLLSRVTAAVAPASTAVSNADLTAARAGYLDKLNVTGTLLTTANSPLECPPIASGYVGATTGRTPATGDTFSSDGFQSYTTTSGTLTQVLSYTGAGVIEGLALAACLTSGTTGGDASGQVEIDGVVYIADGAVTANSGNATFLYGCNPVHGGLVKTGSSGAYIYSLIPGAGIPFKSSLVLKARRVSGTSLTAIWYAKVRKTA